MRAYLVALGLIAMLAVVPAGADAQGNDCQFPGNGIGVGGTPPSTDGTFPGGGSTGGSFPGGNCSTPGAVSASEPLTLALTGVALLGAAFLRRRRS